MGYPNDILTTRADIDHGNYALLPPEGLVDNVLPGFENATTSILASKRIGAGFADYIVTLHEGGKNTGFAGEEGVQSFVFVVEGAIKASADGETYDLSEYGYLYCPPGVEMKFENAQKEDSRVYLFKMRYTPLEGEKEPWVVSGNAHDVEKQEYDGMENVLLQDLLPMEFAFDVNFHILTFLPTGCHPFVETHYQEHGAYFLSGEGMYNLDNKWRPVKKDDYIWMGPYNIQACYAIGREPVSYIYTKDCHRHPEV